MNNICDFGAVGDGKTVNTAAIQAAIDAGGIVYVPEGVFVTGTLWLKSNGGLRLAPGAVLLASDNQEDYNGTGDFPQNDAWPEEYMNGKHLIIALEAENVSIDGYGTIDGNGRSFWGVYDQKKHGAFICYPTEHPGEEHPGQLLYFCDCEHVQARNVTLVDSPFWHCFCHGCKDVLISGLTIRGDVHHYTNDGIDIDCCENVTVSDCRISVGDDAITIRCYDETLINKRICQNIAISNCILHSSLANGMRIGVGRGEIRNCTISNLVMNKCVNGFEITGRYNPIVNEGGRMENIHIDNVMMEAIHPVIIRAVSNESHPPVYDCRIRNFTFSRIHAKCKLDSVIIGHDFADISDISFNDCDFVLSDNNELDNGLWPRPSDSHVFTVKNAERISFFHTRIRHNGETNGWADDIYCENSTVTASACEFKGGIKQSDI